jgi:hypothetical protein
MGVVIGICTKHLGGENLIYVTDVGLYMYSKLSGYGRRRHNDTQACVPTFVKSPLFAKSSLKAGPKTSRKEPPGSLMARDLRSITGRGFQIFLSRSFVGEVSPFISAFGVFCKSAYRHIVFANRHQNLKRRNEGEDFSCETSR